MGAGSSIGKKSALTENEVIAVSIQPTTCSSDINPIAQIRPDQISHLRTLQETQNSSASQASCTISTSDLSIKSQIPREDFIGEKNRIHDSGNVESSYIQLKQAEASRASRKIFDFMTKWYTRKDNAQNEIVQTPIQVHSSNGRSRNSESEMLDSITADIVGRSQFASDRES